MTFGEVMASIEAARPTIVVHAAEPSPAITERLGPVAVDVTHEPTDGDEEEYVSVRRDGAVLASVSLATLLERDPPDRVPWNPTAAEASLRAFFSSLSGVHFSSLDRSRLLAVSRSIEGHVWHRERGTLHAGFQRLSNLRPVADTYRELGECPALDVAVYGELDWDPPSLGDAVVHPAAHEELRDYWFLAYADDDATVARLLLAREVSPGQYRGVWTTDADAVAAVVDRLAEHYPAVERSETA